VEERHHGEARLDQQVALGFERGGIIGFGQLYTKPAKGE
jgi:hypothetical protein